MSQPFDGWHLPGLRPVATAPLQGHEGMLRYPVLNAADVEAAASQLIEAGEALRQRTVSEIIAPVAAAAARLGDAPMRQQALRLLPSMTGYSPEMAELVLDRMLADWSAPALDRLIRAEFGSHAPLDAFTAAPDAPHAALRAIGPRLAFNVFSGNVPGVAVTAIIRCLLVKAPVLGKTASDEPVLPVLFARALAEVDPELGAAVAMTYWPGGAESLERAAMHAADTVVVYGGRAAVASVRATVAPDTRLVVHGPRVSVAFVARDALGNDSDARNAARDLAAAASIFDQHGCVSPHAAYVERGGAVSPVDFAGYVAAAMGEWSVRAPTGRLGTEERAALRRERDASEFRGLADGSTRILSSPDHDYTVTYDERPDFTPSCLNRFLRVIAVDDLEQAAARFEHLRDVIQTAGLACASPRREDLAEQLADVGFSRICPIGAMPWPPPEWHHDGAGPLRELVRFVDLV